MPINFNYVVIYDFETSSIDPYTTQPLSLSAIMLDPRKLEIVKDSEFNTLVCPIKPDKIEKEALEVNKLNLEDLLKAPSQEAVWSNFTKYLKKYARGKSKWDLVIPAGHNIVNFDNIICKQMCDKYKTGAIFHPTLFFDTMALMYMWTENNSEISKLNMDFLRKYMEMGEESVKGAHTSKQDVYDSAAILCKFLKLHRGINVKFKGAFAK